MQLVTGTVVGGKVVFEDVTLPEGTAVTIFAKDSEATVHLPRALQVELEEALEEADREEGISGDELLEKLRNVSLRGLRAARGPGEIPPELARR